MFCKSFGLQKKRALRFNIKDFIAEGQVPSIVETGNDVPHTPP